MTTEIKWTQLKRKIFKVSDLEIDLLCELLNGTELTRTSADATETVSAKDLHARLLLLRARMRLDETKHPS